MKFLGFRTVVAVLAGLAGSVLAAPSLAQCSVGEQYLPLSGMCSGAASGKLGWPGKFFYDGVQTSGCKAEVAETAFPGQQVLLYWAATCAGAPARLEVSAGAHQALLNVVSGGMNTAGAPLQVGTIIGGDSKNSPAPILAWARSEMGGEGYDPKAKAACKVYRARSFAKDAWVVDNAKARQAQPKDAYPEIFCGRYGYTGDSRAYWRVFGGHSWFFDLGQGGFADFDPDTMKLVPRLAQAAQTAKVIPPAPNNTGTTNIAGDPAVAEQIYGQARKYTIYSGGDRARVRYCVAERDFGGSILRIGYDGGQWQLAVPYEVGPNYYGGFDIDGRTSGISGTAANGWTFVWIARPQLDAIKRGKLMILDIGRASLDFTLDGSTAAILKVAECVQRLQ